MMFKRSGLVCLLLLLLVSIGAQAEKLPYARSKIEPPTAEWEASVERHAPDVATVKAPTNKLLVFSLHTGYNHLVIPHVNRVFEILGKKTGAFDVDVTYDIEHLSSANLARYDVLVLNNNCSKGPRRNLLLDVLEADPKYAELTEQERRRRAEVLEQSMLDFVAGGKGLVVVHGAPVLLNNSEKFTGMVGAAFHYHPPNQEVTVRVVEEEHPLVAAFRGKGPLIHRDEPYCFNGPYEHFNFRPLLSMDVEQLKDRRGEVDKLARYVAWIKPHGKGRVFYCSPSHFPESYESATLLRFILDGVQYAAGDLACDDTPIKK